MDTFDLFEAVLTRPDTVVSTSADGSELRLLRRTGTHLRAVAVPCGTGERILATLAGPEPLGTFRLK